MNKRFYSVTRDLHLYLGLFISPFILVFSVSVFFFVHSWTSTAVPKTRTVTGLNLPSDLAKQNGAPLIDALKPVLKNLDVAGEIGWFAHGPNDKTLIVPVSIPGRATTVTIDTARNEATIVVRETGIVDAIMKLHKSPGGHTPTISMNWLPMRAWRWFADASAYLTLFIATSGVYLWYVLRAERKIGLILLSTGAITFFGLVYAVSH